MKRNEAITKSLPDPKREAVELPIGPEGAYYVGDAGGPHTSRRTAAMQRQQPGVEDYNTPPQGQPGLWCGWVPNSDGTAIEWNQIEKFYSSAQWLQYLIDQFLKPWGYRVSGSVNWSVEEQHRSGVIAVKQNSVLMTDLEMSRQER